MFKLFPLFGSPGDSISPEEIVGKQPYWPSWSYTTTTIKDKDGKDISVQELIDKHNKLSESVEHLRGEAEKFYEENKKLKDQLNSIEEDGTEEHNEAVKLRQENAQLKVEIENWRIGVMHWKDLYDEKANYVNDLVKEVNGLRRLKKENVDLIERNQELLEKYNGTVTMGSLKYMEAKLQIVQNNYKKCSEERDEFKHQLKAANKEIDRLKRWKKEQLTVQSWWDKVDSYVRDHDDAPLGGIVANTCLNFLKERDELKKRVGGLSLTIDRKNFEIDDLKAEIKKLKEDIVDYVIKKDDKLEEAKETIEALKSMKTQGFEDYDPSDFEEPKQSAYPMHWGGCDGAASAFPEQYKEWLSKQKDKAVAEKKEWQCPCSICKKNELDSPREYDNL